MQLIVALDIDNKAKALALVDTWDPSWCILKVGLEAFTRFGPSFVRDLVARGFRIFLDLKFHDIPNTVAASCRAAADLGVWMLNVHAAGGLAMMQAARDALAVYGDKKPYLIAVTVLTSQEASSAQVIALAERVKKAGLDGVVCSALEVPQLKKNCGHDFLTVTPGIRLAGDSMDDQKRVVTPEKARALGSDYAVIGRSITRAADATATLKALVLNA
ncbi:MAG: orotidine-5'-phosphate decarboxylase [Gammaproteobacteria bacterium]|nr:orotidine-5'-phosphate decarboxylase [Gammaproteobacteria bacterium]MCH9763388.1 orotidine-5'-phosphate decarboxylase [Gammaproteobacteria bacterium]